MRTADQTIEQIRLTIQVRAGAMTIDRLQDQAAKTHRRAISAKYRAKQARTQEAARKWIDAAIVAGEWKALADARLGRLGRRRAA